MHDFLLAKEIFDATVKIVAEKKLENIKMVHLEIGSVSLAHDDMPEHTEEISVENLEFALKEISQNTPLAAGEYSIKKVPGESWKITEIEVK
jgi:Zn finger protein HypA/HybF involved in hydrogenase expression